MVWYDPQQRELLQEAGLPEGQTVHGSLAPANPAPIRAEIIPCTRAPGRQHAAPF